MDMNNCFSTAKTGLKETFMIMHRFLVSTGELKCPNPKSSLSINVQDGFCATVEEIFCKYPLNLMLLFIDETKFLGETFKDIKLSIKDNVEELQATFLKINPKKQNFTSVE